MNHLLADVAAFRDARGWSRYHTPRNLAEALSVEAGELLRCFLWDGAFPSEPLFQDRVEEELADVMIYALNLCLVLGVDPDDIIRRKMAKNAEKYPV